MAKLAGDSPPPSTRLLASDELPPTFAHNPGADSPFLLVGDHAGRAVPRILGDLGVPAADFERHIAWDIGVQGLGVRLAEALGACFIAQRYSRLVIDCNRDPSRPDAMPEVSDGTAIPANMRLAPTDRAARVAAIFDPYHRAIAAELDARGGRPTVMVALHSFTPVMAGFRRPWRFGVLHLGASPFCGAVLACLRAGPDGPDVGDNEPYRMDDVDFTIPHHAIGRGLDYLELEVRQDLIADAAGQEAVAARLARILPEALASLSG